MTIKLLENERLDDLQRKGYQIIQKTDGFCFGMDAVLLAGFANIRSGDKVVDLGTGSGILPLLLEARYEEATFIGLEIQEQMADMATRSVALNGLEKKIRIDQGDIKEASGLLGNSCFDVVVSNPPYMNDCHGLKNPDLTKAISRHELCCNLEDVVRETSRLLKQGGYFFMVHRPRRLVEIITTLSRFKMEAKRIRMVHPFYDRDANIVLIECIKGGGSMLKVESPLIVYEKEGIYTKEVLQMYHGQERN